jgi:xanthine dehydrogenase accessory factor
MLELADRLLPLLAAGGPLAVATAIDVLGSSPHLVGTSMVVTSDGGILGAVSGGCVEDAALRECRGFLDDGVPRVRRFGFGDAAAARAGLACGGELDVLVHPLGGPGVLAELRAAAAGRPAAVAVVTAGPAAVLGAAVTSATAEGLVAAVPDLPVGLLRAAIDGRRDSGRSGGVEIACGAQPLRLFVDVAAPARRMIIGGATETAAALTAVAASAGYRVTVCDPRPDFAVTARFPGADLVLPARVHEVVAAAALAPGDAVCLLSHDEDLDPLALAAALESDAGYVGALGSRSTTARRRARLLALGVPVELLHRLHMPIGLDIGARTPPELAVAVLAEVLAVRSGRAATPLHAGNGAIHRSLPIG